MTWKVVLHPKVLADDLRPLSRDVQARLVDALDDRLAVDPAAFGSPLTRTLKGYWKLRVGDYRIVFRLSGQEVQVLGIGNRKDVYRWIAQRRSWPIPEQGKVPDKSGKQSRGARRMR